jgi:outer membrane lipase/esterase
MVRIIPAIVAALVLSCLTASPGNAATGPYDNIYVFGDSLSDRGNIAEALGNAFPDPPSYHYSFTNGPTAISLVANGFGLAADPSLWLTNFQDVNSLFPSGYKLGTSYAVGGATAAANSPNGIPGINLPDQLGAYIAYSGGQADPNALYTVFIGGNDVRDATLPGGGSTAAIANGVTAELAALQTLKAAGATNFLVVNVPNIGVIPQFAQQNPGLAAEATANAQLYDTLLSSGVDTFVAGGGVNLDYFNLYDLNEYILANASTFGITNTTDFCYTGAPFSTATTAACGPDAENIGSLAYWNNVHPTAKVQALWAASIYDSLNPAAAPEPMTWTLMILGMGCTGAMLRRKGGSRIVRSRA